MRAASASTNGHSSSSASARFTQPQRSASVAVDVAAAEDDLERAGASHQARQALRAAAARDDAERDLGLAEHGPVTRREPQVERRHELAAAAPHAPFDHGDRRLRHRAEPVAHRVEEAELVAGAVPRLPWQLEDEVHVGMRDEELGVRRVDDHHADVLVGGQRLAAARQVEHEREVEQVDRRMVDRHPGDAILDLHPQRLVLVCHGRTVGGPSGR